MVEGTVSEDLTKDTSIREARVGVNYGGQVEIRVRGLVAGFDNFNTLVECIMPENPYPSSGLEIRRVKLRLNCSTFGDNQLVGVYKLNHSDWTEGTGTAVQIGPYEHDGGDGVAFAEQAGAAPPPAAATFVSDGGEVGGWIWNSDDLCYGIITVLTETKATIGGGLTGGTDDDFDDGEGFIMFSEEDSEDATWLSSTTSTAWSNPGGDYDDETDWAGIGAGLIAKRNVTGLGWFEFDITKFVNQEGITWGSTFDIILIPLNVAGNDEVRFFSSEYGTPADRPEVQVTYWDPLPTPATITAFWDKKNKKVGYLIDGLNDNDFTALKLFRDTGSGVLTTDTVVRIDYDALLDQTSITNKTARGIIENYDGYAEPVVGTTYYVRGFTEDNNNTGADGTPSNEISYNRPKMRTVGNDSKFDIITAAGLEGTNINVGDDVYIHARINAGTTEYTDIKKCYIDWGDGKNSFATFDTVLAQPSVNPGAAPTTITFLNTIGWTIGDDIVMSQDIGGWKKEVRRITGKTTTVLTVDSAFGNFAWTTDAAVFKTRKHNYTTTGTKSPLCSFENHIGFESGLNVANTDPVPQAIAPEAVIDTERINLLVDEEMSISGLRSKGFNMDKSLQWGTVDAYIHDGGDGVAFAEDGGEDFPTDGAFIGYLVYNITDGCMGIITSFTGTDVANMVGGLSGGTNDDFDDGDVFAIYGSGFWAEADATYDSGVPTSTIAWASSGGSKSLKLNVTDDTEESDLATKTVAVTAETFNLLQSGCVVDNDNVSNGDTVTINGTEFEVDATPTGNQFEKGGSSTLTAVNLAAAINGAGLIDYYAVSAGDVVMIGGSLISTFVTSDAAAFIIQLRVLTLERDLKNTDMLVELRRNLDTAGGTRSLAALGPLIQNLSGTAWTVADKDALEEVNDGTVSGLLAIIDGSIKKLYSLSRGITITEQDYTPTDQTAGTNEGVWGFKGAFLDSGVYT